MSKGGMPRSPLAELASVTMGQSPDSAAINTDERGLPFLQGSAEFGPRHPTAKHFCSPPLRIAKRGATLLSVRAPVGAANAADQDYCIGRGLGAVLARGDRANNVFLRHAIEHEVDFLHRRSQGSTFLAIASKDLLSLPLPAPAPPEQERIAEILSTVEEAIEQTEALIAKTQLIKAGLMHDLLTRGIGPGGQLRPPREEAPQLYKESPLGWIPKKWEPLPLGALSTVVRGSTPRPAKDPRFFDGDFVPWITVGELSRDDWPYLLTTSTRLTEAGAAYSRFLQPGTLVISNSGFGCGVPKILAIGGCANDGIAAFLDLSERCVPLFLYYYLFSQIETLRTRVARGNDQPNLNTEMLAGFRVLVPDRQEQVQISGRLWDLAEQRKSEERLVEKLRALKRGLMDDLLTGRVRVPLPTMADGDRV